MLDPKTEALLLDIHKALYALHLNYDEVAKRIGTTKKGFRRKLRGEEPFTDNELSRLKSVLYFRRMKNERDTFSR